MKNKFLLIVALFFATVTAGQNCNFTYSMAGAVNVIAFSPSNAFPAPPFRFMWTFGDGATSADSTPVHVYNGFGTFYVCCDIYDANQVLTCTSCDSVPVGNPIGGACNFLASIDTSNNTVVFTAQPSGATSGIHWDFGNGDSAIGTVVTYTYPSTGVYTVCMTETDNFLGTILCTVCNTITIGSSAGSNCSFTPVPDSTNVFLINFYANVNAGATVTWVFGDNTTGGGINTSHTYNSTGPFTVCMTSVYNGISCTYCNTIYPGGSAGNCSFTYRADSSNVNSIEFVASTSAFGSGVTWDFGDGSYGQGDSVTHVYATIGTFYVCMTEYNSGAVICTSCLSVTVGLNFPNCQAYFLGVNVGLTGYFIDLSNANAASTSYYWDFGDGVTSGLRFPQHTYASPGGTFNVCLTIADSLNAGCSSQYCSPITVDTTINSLFFCQAYFTILQLAPFQFDVVNLSSGTNLNFSWDFGDGSPVSNLPYPSHYYSAVGSYDLCLTVSDGNGCSNTYCDTLSVDTLGNIFRSMTGFTINVLSPAQLTAVQQISTPKLFAVYPNPVTSVLTVSIASDMKGLAIYKVYALDGVEVTRGTFTGNENELHVEHWQQGVYILEVSDAQGFRSYQKIVKE